VLALASATGFGVMPVLTKVAYDDGTTVAGLLAVRFSLAALVLLAIARVRGELPAGLSGREAEGLVRLARGLTNKKIAKELSISP